jgi:hypothetical protein
MANGNYPSGGCSTWKGLEGAFAAFLDAGVTKIPSMKDVDQRDPRLNERIYRTYEYDILSNVLVILEHQHY